ncbi:hypothetical protein [Halomontanus rarus]|uniref:hypothetical protein n=1 Tax=Halomontanus rarus TaxID=3034020 RepID=UPI001A97DEFF
MADLAVDHGDERYAVSVSGVLRGSTTRDVAFIDVCADDERVQRRFGDSTVDRRDVRTDTVREREKQL